MLGHSIYSTLRSERHPIPVLTFVDTYRFSTLVRLAVAAFPMNLDLFSLGSYLKEAGYMQQRKIRLERARVGHIVLRILKPRHNSPEKVPGRYRSLQEAVK